LADECAQAQKTIRKEQNMEQTIEYWGLEIVFVMKDLKTGIVAALEFKIEGDMFVGNDFVIHFPSTRDGAYKDCRFVNGSCLQYCDKPFAEGMTWFMDTLGPRHVWEKINEIMSNAIVFPENYI
jgi:hypothetical protein